MDTSVASKNALPTSEPVPPPSPTQSGLRCYSFLIIFLLWIPLYFAGMFTPALLDDVDTIHAEAAREILLRHDWVTLYTDGIRYLEKAPLMYWAVAASYKLFGISEWSTRLPLMLGVLGGLFAVYIAGKYAYDQLGGFYSSLVLATCIGPYIFTRFQIPDAIVGVWLTLSFYFFLRSLEENSPSRLSCWGFALACALNVLTKGLIGLIFPLSAMGLYLILTGNLRHLLRLRIVSSTVIFLLVAAPWHVLASIRNPAQGSARGFLWFYFVNEHFLRFVNKREPPGYDTVPLLIFWVLLILWVMPWGVFLPQAIREIPLHWKQWRGKLDRRQKANLLFALWALAIVGFFSFSTRQEYYTIPAVPALALLLGGWLAKESRPSSSPEQRAGKLSSMMLFALMVAGSAIGIALLLSSRAPAPGTELADLLQKHPQDYDFSLGHFLDLTPEALGVFRIPLVGAVASLLVGSGLNWFLRIRRRPAQGNLVLAAMMVAVVACVHSAFVTFSPILSSKSLALAIQRHYRPGDVLVVDGRYDQASTLNFYLHVPLRVLHEPSGNLWYGSKFPDAPQVFETPSSFNALWSGPTRVFLWTDQDDPRELRAAPHFLLARSGGKSIFSNRELAQ
jgi:4-amino-4-deoxy-L-arabinose transferase-like glycosyltransferase